MAEDGTGVGHTLLGTNAFQSAIDGLDAAANRMSDAADRMANSAARSTGGGGGAGNGGLWNAASNWMMGKGANGGGVTFNGQDPSHRADGPAQTPQWAQSVGNFAHTMANGNGGWSVNGAYNAGNALGGTKAGLAAAGAVGAISMFGSAANNGASPQDMYNANMLGGTATRMFNQGIGGVNGPKFGMNGVSGSQNASDFYSGLYVLNSQSGYLQGSSQFTKMQSQAGAMGILDPTSNSATNNSSMVGFSSNTTTNIMRAFGIDTFGNDPTQIARQLLDRLGAPKGKIDPKVIQLLRAPQSGLNTTLNNMVAAGAITPDQAKAIATAAYGLLIAQNKGMSASEFDKLTQTASGDPQSKATQAAQAQLKTMGFATSTAQTMMNANANQTDSSVKQLGSFQTALHDSTTLLNKFRNALNSIPGVQQAAGANSGAGGGWLGKVFGAAGFFGASSSMMLGSIMPGSAGLAGLLTGGRGDGSISMSGSSIGGGDTSLSAAGVGFSELGALVSGTVSGPGFVGVGTASTVLGASTTGTSTSGAPNGSSTYPGGSGNSGSTSGGGNGSTTYGTTPGIPMGRVTPAQAIARIQSMMARHVDIGVGLCQMRAHEVYGIGNGAPSAAAAWAAAKYKHSFADMSPPVGAFVFWGGGYGHVAIYAGGGKVYSPGGPGDLSHWVLCTIESITKGWGKPLLGWTEDNNGVRVVRPATHKKSNTSNGHTTGSTTHSSGGTTQTGRGAGVVDGILDPYLSGPSGSSYASMDKSHMIIPGVASGGAVSTGSIRRGGPGGGGAAPQIVFHQGAVVIQFPGAAGGADTAATGRALGKAFAQELAQDSRIKALMAGNRG